MIAHPDSDSIIILKLVYPVVDNNTRINIRKTCKVLRKLKLITRIVETEDCILHLVGNALHREGGPAIEYYDGSRIWYEEDVIHRKGGPAIELYRRRWCLYEDTKGKLSISTEKNKSMGNTRIWVYRGLIHRRGGPAVEEEYGTKLWYGTRLWYKHGFLHRRNGPAVELPDGGRCWYLHDDLHREDGPAIEKIFPHERDWTYRRFLANGFIKTITPLTQIPICHDHIIPVRGIDKAWCRYGILHRDNGPAVEYNNGDVLWYQNGKSHRDNGPAVEFKNRLVEWRKHGVLHREDGPAVIQTGGYIPYNIADNIMDTIYNEHIPKSMEYRWYVNGYIHREDGPAIICNWYAVWVNKGVVHRDTGFAIEYNPIKTAIESETLYDNGIYVYNGKIRDTNNCCNIL